MFEVSQRHEITFKILTVKEKYTFKNREFKDTQNRLLQSIETENYKKIKGSCKIYVFVQILNPWY
jgi:hypothetical protein